MVPSVLRAECPAKDLPSKEAFCYETEDDIGAFAVDIIAPFTYALVLQNHVQRKTAEKYEDRHKNPVHKGWCGAPVCGSEPHIKGYSYPWDESGKRAEIETEPVGFLRCLVMDFHDETEQVHDGSQAKCH